MKHCCHIIKQEQHKTARMFANLQKVGKTLAV